MSHKTPAGATLDTRAFELEGSELGIVLLHGYTAAPSEMRPMGEFLNARGVTVKAPLLPGHSTSPSDLNSRTWRELADAAADAFYSLQGRCERVFVGGLSMGGLLTLHLAQRIPEVAGIIPMAAALRLSDPKHYLIPLAMQFLESLPKSKDLGESIEDPRSADLLWSYPVNPLRFAYEVTKLSREVRENLHHIHQPVLAVAARKDKTVPMSALDCLVEGVSSDDLCTLVLENSGHVLCLDGERHQLFERAYRWLASRSDGIL